MRDRQDAVPEPAPLSDVHLVVEGEDHSCSQSGLLGEM